MRRVLVDYACQRRAATPAGSVRVELDEVLAAVGPKLEDRLMVDETLAHLSEWNFRQARLVATIFGGLTADAAEALGVSAPTAERNWQAARAWLHAQLARKSP